MDLFNVFRYGLGTVVTIYAIVVTVQWAVGWYQWLNSEDRGISMVRRYLIIAGLRLKLTTFWADTTISLLLCVIFALLCLAHWNVSRIGRIWDDANRRPQPIHWRG